MLLESYQDYKDITNLVEDIKMIASELISEHLFKRNFINNLPLIPYNKLDLTKYGEIGKCISDSNGEGIIIKPFHLVDSNNKVKLGIFNNKTCNIVLFFPFQDVYKNGDEENWHPGNIELFFDDNSLFGNAPSTTLIHELQHFYDKCRSKGKYTQNKQTSDYIENDGRTFDDYLKLPHEVSARFTETIRRLDIDGSNISLQLYIDDFINKFQGWGKMTDKVKKSLIRRVSKHWHDIN